MQVKVMHNVKVYASCARVIRTANTNKYVSMAYSNEIIFSN